MKCPKIYVASASDCFRRTPQIRLIFTAIWIFPLGYCPFSPITVCCHLYVRLWNNLSLNLKKKKQLTYSTCSGLLFVCTPLEYWPCACCKLELFSSIISFNVFNSNRVPLLTFGFLKCADGRLKLLFKQYVPIYGK